MSPRAAPVYWPGLTRKPGVITMADLNPGDGDARQLKRYWLVGKGALKIRWGTPGDFTRCVRQVEKYMPGRAEGYCANLHHQATGLWPGDRNNPGRKP